MSLCFDVRFTLVPKVKCYQNFPPLPCRTTLFPHRHCLHNDRSSMPPRLHASTSSMPSAPPHCPILGTAPLPCLLLHRHQLCTSVPSLVPPPPPLSPPSRYLILYASPSHVVTFSSTLPKYSCHTLP